MNLEKVVLKRYEYELKETQRLFKELSDKDKDVYIDMYINSREYLNSVADKDMPIMYKKYLSLYTANSEFLNYQNHKKI